MASKPSRNGKPKETKESASQSNLSPQVNASPDVVTPGHMKELIDVIRSDVSAMHRDFGRATAITKLQTKVYNNEQKIEEMETTLTTLDTTISELQGAVALLQAEKTCLQACVDDQENRSRRQNIRVVGLPEKLEKDNPTIFMESVLLEVFGEDNFPRRPEVDRAHCTLRPPPPPNAPPRAMIGRLHHCKTRELVLKQSYERLGQLTYRGNKVSFFPDLSTDLLRRRAAFNPVKKQLHQAGVKFSLAHPATLCFSFNESRHEFKSPEDVSAFITCYMLPAAAAPTTDTEPKDMPPLEE